ncbi:MAG: TatD family hydrolase [Bacteroidales bacterium]|nr:TatD family hydrolase [Bacteroidales bacterium]
MIDTHTHIYEKAFADDIDSVIDRAKEAGVTRMILPSCNMSDAPLVAETCAAHPDTCFALYGLHPTEMGDDPMAEAEQLMDFAHSHGSFVGIGEIGLDLHWDKSRKDEQVAVLKWQLSYAYDHSLPVSIHCREAVWLLMETFAQMGNRIPCGSLHCFAGSPDEAQTICRKWPQLMFGFGGSSTYKNSKVAHIATLVPKDRIITETDAPYLTPVPFRGKRNEPAYIPLIVARLAEEMQLPAEEVAQLTTDNAMRLFFPNES